jgi:hypothetical protein
MTSRNPRFLTLGTVLLVLAASFGIFSAAQFGGIIPGFMYGGVYTQSPTTTYSGYFSINYVGVYHNFQAMPVCRTAFPPCFAPGEVVFFLKANNGTIRLIFYCGGVVKYFCESPSQLSVSDGACLHVKGTLIEPSEWSSSRFDLSMHFDGDFVFGSETLPKTSCS